MPTIRILLLSIILYSCKKQTAIPGNFVTLQVYAGVDNQDIIVPNLKSNGEALEYYKDAAKLNLSGFSFGLHRFYIHQTTQPIAFYFIQDTMPKSEPVLRVNLNLDMGQTYTLFLAGPRNDLDTLLVKENIPTFQPTDSMTAFRFVNLSNDAPVSINLKGEAYGSLANNLPYLSVTEYRKYPVVANMTPYEFEIRDAATHELLATYTDSDMLGKASGRHRWLQKSRNHIFCGIRGVTSGNNKPQVRGFYDTY